MTRDRAGTGYEIEQHGRTFDVRFNGRSVAYDRDDLEEALGEVKRHMRGRGDPQAPVVFVHADGYREAVTR